MINVLKIINFYDILMLYKGHYHRTKVKIEAVRTITPTYIFIKFSDNQLE